MRTIYTKLLFLMLILPLGALAQSTLRGTVTEKSSGQPLPGVNIVVEGTTNGVSTDFDGKYELTGLNAGDRISFSYIGYGSVSIAFEGQATQDVAMEEDANQLSEVVVQVGYGTVRKKDVTGAVTTVTEKDFNQGANVTVENLLNGRVAGVTINTSGAPGSGSQIRIRGGSSLNASNDPLIIVDGLPLTNTTNAGSTSSIGGINPNDIESFTVLKDASATAIYGVRASNGVIIITTKRGSKKLAVDYNFTYGSGKLVKKVGVFGAERFRELIEQYQPDLADNLGTPGTNTDWQEEIYRRTDYVDNSLSIRGNLFDAIPARLSLGNTYQEGLRLTNEYTRNTVSTSLSPSMFADHLRLRVNATYSNERNRFTDAVEGSALRFDPTRPVYDAGSPFGGFYEYYGFPNGGTTPVPTALAPRNPVAQLLQTYDTGFNDRIYGNFEVDYKFHFLPELRAVVNLGFDQSRGKRRKHVGGNNTVASSPSNDDVFYGVNEVTERLLINRLLDAYGIYTKTFGKLTTELQAGYSYQKFLSEEYKTNNVNNPTYSGATVDTKTPQVLIGFFGRANFSFDDRYLLTLSMRRDGTSRFGSENRWDNFPAAAFAWRINNDFFKESKAISDMKLRVGFGVTGQQDIGDDAADEYLQIVSVGNNESQYVFGTTPYPLAITQQYNTSIRWEKTSTFNVGLDLGLYDRVNATLDLFYKESKDLLLRAALPDGANFSNVGFQNIGSMTVKGAELGINADIIKKENISWNVNFNVTKFERRIKDLAFDTDIRILSEFGGTGATLGIYREGFTPNSFEVYKQLYDTGGNPIEGAFADLNGDGLVNAQDRYIYRNPDPDATFGFASNLNVGNFDFSFNLRASVGNRVFNAVDANRAQFTFLNFDGFPSNLPTAVDDSNFVNNNDQITFSDYYIENASFLRLDNVTVGYTFQKWFNETSSVRLFAGVQNAFVWTEYSGLDPEITNNGIDNFIYPRQRSFLFGANIKF